MKITYIGQTGLAPLSPPGTNQRANRVQSLAVNAAQAGHDVTLVSSPLFTFADLVHVHGLTTATSLLWLAALISPKTAYVLTIDSLPARPSLAARLILWQARRVCDRITVTTRQLQYTLLTAYNTRATYIPDGYVSPSIKPIPAKNFGLRRGQYVLNYITDKADLSWLAKSYKTLKTSKKIVALVAPASFSDLQAVAKRNKIDLIELHGHRQLASLASHAALIILPGLNTPLDVILQAMAAKKAIIASTYHLHQETLGTSAQFVQAGDTKSLASALQNIINNKNNQAKYAKQAHRRASAHFQLSRIIPEYLRLYNSLATQSESPLPSLDGIISDQRPLFTRRHLAHFRYTS